MLQIRQILVPIDDSPLTDKVLDHAFTIAERFGAKVKVLYVRHDTHAETPDDIARDEDEVEREREITRETALLMLRGHSLPADRVEGVVRTGDPVSCIVEAAGDHSSADGADLIVMGTHGPRGLADAILGTTTEQVLLRARKPMFVVREDPL